MNSATRLPAADAATSPSTRVGASIVIGHALLLAAVLFVLLHGWERDLHVPLRFSSDSLIALLQSKSTVDNGWWWSNPMLGAPFALDELAFPTNSNVDQAIVWAVGRVVRDPMASVTLAWAVMVILSGLSAAWCMRRLGVSVLNALAAATLFALSPFALYRNIDHFWLVIYLVPFPCTVALLLAAGRPPERWTRAGWPVLIAGCALLGFNYVYFAFFGCFFIGVAAIVGALAYRRTRIVVAGAVCIAVIGGATLLNLAPSFYSWSRHGRPLIVRDKVPAESEVYGLKIRQLVSPVFVHPFPPFRAWTEKESAAAFPVETENMTSRLGLVGSIGFLGLLALLFVPGGAGRFGDEHVLRSASQLTLAAVLLATVGGFGSLFNLLITPEIRAYNRICPLIEFLAMTAIALALDSTFKRLNWRVLTALAVLALGLNDQRRAALELNVDYPRIAAEVAPLEQFVRTLESRVPPGAMVLQLPFRTYMNDGGVAQMKPYDHVKLYIVSRSIRWSYPALSNEQLQWQQAVARLDASRLPGQLAAEGFSAIVIDRNGYEDHGAALIANLRAQVGNDDVIVQNDRYLALDVSRFAGAAGGMARLSTAPALSATGLGACSGQPLLNIDRIGAATAPFGAPVHVTGARELRVSGWAVDPAAQKAARGVDLMIDAQAFPALYGTDRADVVDYFKRPGYLSSGFTAVVAPGQIGKGAHALAIRIVSADGQCYFATPGVPVVVD